MIFFNPFFMHLNVTFGKTKKADTHIYMYTFTFFIHLNFFENLRFQVKFFLANCKVFFFFLVCGILFFS
jgi:hypothetical protein